MSPDGVPAAGLPDPRDRCSLYGLLSVLPPPVGVAVVRDGERVVVAAQPGEIVVADGDVAFDALDRMERERGFWVGYCAYDLGRAVERVHARATDDRHVPDLAFARFDARLTIHPDGSSTVDGTGPGRDTLERARWLARRIVAPTRPAPAPGWATTVDRNAHRLAVEQIRRLLHAGDCYQVNLTRRLSHPRALDPIPLFMSLWEHNPAPHAALVTFGTRGPAIALASASPELFLGVDGDRLTTRPIKGTDRDAGALARSAKDAAEHVMIVDLARNDLGRVCVPGTVGVPELMAIEAHPGLYHMVSTVSGRRRAGVSLGAVVRALFPAASITGAPKPRVMQIVEDVEPVRRGAYCGALGWIDGGAGRAQLAVTIRTFVIIATAGGGITDLGVGGGIVADSTAAREWDETTLKAARLLEAAGAGGGAAQDSGAPGVRS
jgi:para-aminobenzoate synthetase component 1